MHDLGENLFCGLAFQLGAHAKDLGGKKKPGEHLWVSRGYLGQAGTSQRKNILTCWAMGSHWELCSRRLGVVSALLPGARTVSPEQPPHAQPYTREFKKRDDISCTAAPWFRTSSRCFQKESLKRKSLMGEKWRLDLWRPPSSNICPGGLENLGGVPPGGGCLGGLHRWGWSICKHLSNCARQSYAGHLNAFAEGWMMLEMCLSPKLCLLFTRIMTVQRSC